MQARRLLARFGRAAQSAAKVQDRLLKEKLARHATSEFGRKHGFARIRTYQDFVRAVPIQSYEDLRPYVDRVANGETTALFDHGTRVRMLAVTSGSEAMGEVTMQLEDGDRRVLGRGASTDVIEASAKAYVDGLNKLAHLAAEPVT